jgi:AbiV family abortive infection protein
MRFRDTFGILSDEERAAVETLLEKYKGHLPISQIAEGIRVTLANARGLLEDAALLASSGRWARSMALLIATMEEVGKVSVLASMSRIPKDNQKLWADVWESFRKHQHKSTWSFVSTYPNEAKAHPAILVTAACQQFTLAEVCERVRQYGLYVDYHASEKRWLSPQEVSSQDVETWRVRAEKALTQAEGCASLGLFSERALELQREVYSDFNSTRPRRKDTRPDHLERALEDGPKLATAYFRRLIQEGVLSADTDLSILGVPLTELMRDADSAEGSEGATSSCT